MSPQIPLKYERQHFIVIQDIIDKRWVVLRDIAAKHSVIFKAEDLETTFIYGKDYVLIRITEEVDAFPGVEVDQYVVSWTDSDCPHSRIPDYVKTENIEKRFEIQWAVYPDAPTITEEDPPFEQNHINVIVFIGDGMGPGHHDILSNFVTGDVNQLPYQNQFLNEPSGNTPSDSQQNFSSGQANTSNYGGGITDSAAGATSIFTGITVNNGTVGQLIPFREDYLSGDDTDPIDDTDMPDIGDCIYDTFEYEVPVAFQSVWKYLIRDNYTPPPNNWKDLETDFDYTDWDEGQAPLGYNDAIINTEIDYGGDPANKYITTYFRHEFDSDSSREFDNMIIQFIVDDGMVAYLNGEEIIRHNMPSDDPICHAQFASSAKGPPAETAVNEVRLDSLVRRGKNVLAVEVHQATLHSSDLMFDMALYQLDIDLTNLASFMKSVGGKVGAITTSYWNDATPSSTLVASSSRYNYDELKNSLLDYLPDILWGGGANGGVTQQEVEDRGLSYITTRTEMEALQPGEKSVANFSANGSSGIMPYEYDYYQGSTNRYDTVPFLSEMVTKSLELMENDNGFFLMVETEFTDEASHAHQDARLVYAMDEYNNAINVALNWAKDRTDTIIVILADHDTGNPSINPNDWAAGEVPTITWGAGGHTSLAVPYYVHGLNAASFDNILHHSEIFCGVRSAMVGPTYPCGTRPPNVTPPVITLNGDAYITMEYGDSFVDPGATATDDVDGIITDQIQVIGAISGFQMGEQILEYKIVDSSGNEASVSRTVNVVDTTPPVLTLSGDIEMSWPQDAQWSEPGYLAYDLFSGNLTSQVQITGAVDVNTPGTYVLTYTVQDSSLNETSATRTVHVV